MIRRPPRSTPLYSSAASDVYKRQKNASSATSPRTSKSARPTSRSLRQPRGSQRPRRKPRSRAAKERARAKLFLLLFPMTKPRQAMESNLSQRKPLIVIMDAPALEQLAQTRRRMTIGPSIGSTMTRNRGARLPVVGGHARLSPVWLGSRAPQPTQSIV